MKTSINSLAKNAVNGIQLYFEKKLTLDPEAISHIEKEITLQFRGLGEEVLAADDALKVARTCVEGTKKELGDVARDLSDHRKQLKIEAVTRKKVTMENETLCASLTDHKKKADENGKLIISLQNDVSRSRDKVAEVTARITHLEDCDKLSQKLTQERIGINSKLAETEQDKMILKKEFNDLHRLYISVKEERDILQKREKESAGILELRTKAVDSARNERDEARAQLEGKTALPLPAEPIKDADFEDSASS